jgi:hypothetical protein
MRLTDRQDFSSLSVGMEPIATVFYELVTNAAKYGIVDAPGSGHHLGGRIGLDIIGRHRD